MDTPINPSQLDKIVEILEIMQEQQQFIINLGYTFLVIICFIAIIIFFTNLLMPFTKL